MNFGQNLYQWFLSNAQSLVVVDDEIKNNAKEFAKIYLSDNILDYAECEAGTMIPIMNLLF